ncbi:MAG: farnesyl diphosphate synthase [Gammaproteobacteria bacterium]
MSCSHSMTRQNNPALKRFADENLARVDTTLNDLLPPENILPASLHQAMRYSVLNGGKRIRPLLVYAAGQACQTPVEALNIFAAAVEMIHAYSLIHDDLPAMDNDALRRGRPTCHIKFGEAEAILAGDALQALAFRSLAHSSMAGCSAEQRLEAIKLLAEASGSRGMVGGQSIDLASINKQLDIAELEDMHVHKTGALIRASVLGAVICSAKISSQDQQALDHYAQFIGLAFQVQDDILDVTGDTAETGKNTGADQALNKPTYVSLLGLSEARRRVTELHESALDSLKNLGQQADPLRWLSAQIVTRRR